MNKVLVGVLAAATLLSAGLYGKVGARHAAGTPPKPDRRNTTSPDPVDNATATSSTYAGQDGLNPAPPSNRTLEADMNASSAKTLS